MAAMGSLASPMATPGLPGGPGLLGAPGDSPWPGSSVSLAHLQVRPERQPRACSSASPPGPAGRARDWKANMPLDAVARPSIRLRLVNKCKAKGMAKGMLFLGPRESGN
jgi:hypothetical protein